MSDIAKRLRGQEPLNLVDRLLCADEIDRLYAEVSMFRNQLDKDQALVMRLCRENERLRELLDRAGDTLPPCELYEEIQAALAAGGE